MYLKALDFIVVVLYLALMSVIGIYFSKRQTSGETYFLAGRGVSGILAGISILATLLSTISYLSIPGEMIRFGIGYFSSYLALILVVPVVSKVIIPYLMRLPVTSIYEYLEKRYGFRSGLWRRRSSSSLSVLISFSKEIFGLEHSISFMWIMPASLLVSMSVSYAGGFFFPAPRRVSLGTLEGQRMPYSPPSGQD